MNKINEFLSMINNGLKNKQVKEHDFSANIEDFIHNNFWDIEKENHEIAIFLNDDVVDICEQTEPGLEGTNFRKEIEQAYNDLLKMLNN